jgi:endo-1,4-beta-xylanase
MAGFRPLCAVLSAALLAAAAPAGAQSTAAQPAAATDSVCDNRTGEHDGFFFTFWKSSGEACLTFTAPGGYATRYRLNRHENLVAGLGWRVGTLDRRLTYRADRFEAGTSSYLTLYGWSTDPLIEYYVVDSWGSDFTPPGPGARMLGTVDSDGGTYRIYRTKRTRQPSILGTRTFHQFWSVRTERRAMGGDNAITFANHVAAWRRHGMRLGSMNYQVLATEGYGSTGESRVQLWQR